MKRSIVFICLATCLGMLHAEEWMDVTQFYVVNPRFENNSRDGWNYSASYKIDTQYGCTESFNGTFDVNQTMMGLPNGKYRVGVQGYYRYGSASSTEYSNYVNGNGTINAYLYGNSSQRKLSSIYQVTTDYGYPGTTSVGWPRVVPNSMESASYYFAAGFYKNTQEVTVTDGTLKMGVRSSNSVYSDWCIFTNWTLEYYCTPATLTSISFPNTNIKIGRGENYPLSPVFTPEITPTTKYKLTWSSSNSSVAAIGSDGVVRGVKNGTAVITCKDQVSGKSATVNVTVETAEMSAANVIINEIQTRNIDQFIDPSWNYGGWIELYNPTNVAADLSSAYVRDAKGHSFRLPFDVGALPANGYKVLWFDHFDRYGNDPKQIDFKLNADGGTIMICNSQGVVVAQQDYPATPARVSYARTKNGGSEWSMSGNPTPGTANIASDMASVQLEAPEVDKAGGFFSGSMTVKVTVPAHCQLLYTTDGSTPSLENGTSYKNASASSVVRTYTVSSTTVYRFRLFQYGMLPSDVVTRSYLKLDKSSHKVPVVSVVGRYEDIYGDDYGIMVRGNGNGRPGNGQSSACNWNMDWQRPVNFEYIVPGEDGNYSTTVFNQLVDMEMCGGWSRAWDPHSFKLRANKVYGEKNMDYTFFDAKPFIRNKSLQLRNGGNDNGCRIKDAALQEVIRRSGLYVDGQAWQPVHVYINGGYHRVLNMREPNNKHNAFSNYGIDTDFCDQFEMSPDSGYIQKSGTKDAFNLWYEKSKTCTNDADYQFICDSLVDIEEYINYMAVELYLGGDDWPQNNVKGFRAIQDDENGHAAGKFHFVLFDLDHAFNTSSSLSTFANKKTYTFNALLGIDENGYDYAGKQIREEIQFVTIFLNMLKNEKFKKQFTDAFCLVSGSVFEPTRSAAIIREVQATMNGALALERGSSDNTANTLVNNLSQSRQSTMINHLKSYLGLSGNRTVTLSANAVGARLLLNGIEIPTGQFSGTLFGAAKVQALAPAGYRFVGWAGSSSSAGGASSVFPNGSTWNYYGNGSLDGTSWKSGMSSYSSGSAPLGYGKSGLKTTVSSGGVTYYFGRSFTLSSDMLQNDLTLDFTIDDGCVVYVNGVEAGRYNMPSGTVSYGTFASTYASGNPDTGSMTLKKSLFRAGTNTICVEVHNNSSTSSDIYWDASLSYTKISIGDIVSQDSIYTLGTSAAKLMAVFEPLDTKEQRVAAFDFPIKVNEVGAANDVFVNEYWKKNDWIELYNNSDYDLDVAGLYVSDNESKLQKFQIGGGNFTASTVIPAHGRMVIWADKLEAETQLHTGFKLSNDEGSMVLITSSETFEANNAAYFAAHPEMKGYTDVLVYGSHEYNQSVGRYPDGGNAIFCMNRPSIGRENTHVVADRFLGVDKGFASVDPAAIEMITVDDSRGAASFEEWTAKGYVFYDVLGKRITKPQPGQVILRSRNPQK